MSIADEGVESKGTLVAPLKDKHLRLEWALWSFAEQDVPSEGLSGLGPQASSAKCLALQH